MGNQVSERSGDLFASGLCCSEGVLTAVAENQGIDSDLVPGIATGFCGGMAYTGNMCGAVSGAIMALGMLLGRRKPEDPRDDLNDAVRKLLSGFEGKFGSTNCMDLLGCDLGTPEGMEKYRNDNLRDRCREFTEEAAGMVMSLLSEIG